ncbi:hypothetical protein N7478_011487 [Penicillium angulare]|uniref:uncharacterized protein n=1 Tax=Penicillium angulare TaxID=116970 RepID=UPI0025409D3E|nr:uncharacterized protein N7478_011487 [Penicillium angulare]KAJ5263882.1 hypothetical protein N7478_011487 [Penicillium angulare]
MAFQAEDFYNDPLYEEADQHGTMIHNPKKVAIIGSGIAGISIANSFPPDSNIVYTPHATVFERESYIGGRARTVMTYDNYAETGHEIAVGGDGFDYDDRWIIWDSRSVGVDLTRLSVHTNYRLDSVGVWDGEQLNFGKPDGRPSDSDLMRMAWRRGEPLNLWEMVANQLRDKGLNDEKDILAWHAVTTALINQNKSPKNTPTEADLRKFAKDWGLTLRPKKKAEGGNERFLKRMLRMSESSLNLNSTVTRIKRYEDLTFDVHWSYKAPNGTIEEHIDRYDAVIIAAPFYETGIAIEPPLRNPPEKVDYTHLHVTSFISRLPLDPETFNMSPRDEVPPNVWHIPDIDLNLINESSISSNSISPPPFIALRTIEATHRDGYFPEIKNIYRIISDQPITDDDIAKLIIRSGVARRNVTFPDQSCWPLTPSSESLYTPWPVSYDGHVRRAGCVKEPDVRWIHRQYWDHGSPKLNDTAQKNRRQKEIAPRLFYISSFEGVDGASMSQSIKHAQLLIMDYHAAHSINR